MKKLFAIVLCICVLVSLCACSADGGSGDVGDFKIKSQEEIKQNLKNYWIKIEVSSDTTETMVFAENDKAIYFSDGTQSGTLYVKGDKGYYEVSDGKKRLIIQGDEAESYAATTQSYLDLYTMAFASFIGDDTFKASGIEMVAGRKCAKYSYKLNLIAYKVSFSFWFDYETGMCMKQQFEGTAEGESGFYKFEVKEFRTNGVNLDSYINLPTEE